MVLFLTDADVSEIWKQLFLLARENWDSLHKQMNLQETMVQYLLTLANLLKFHLEIVLLIVAVLILLMQSLLVWLLFCWLKKFAGLQKDVSANKKLGLRKEV